MRNLKKFAALGISLVTAFSLITGCGSDSDENSTTGNTANDNDVLITIDDIEIPFNIGKFYAYNEQASYEAYYLANGYVLNWSSEFTDTSITNSESETTSDEIMTIEQAVKSDVLERIKMFYVVADYAKKNGATLTDEDSAEIQDYIDKYLAGSQKVVNATGATEESLRQIYETESYYNKGCDMIFEGEDFSVDEDELRQCSVYAIEIYPDSIEFPKETAEAILKRVQAGEDINLVADVYGLVCNTGYVGKGDFNGDCVEQLCLSLNDNEAGITEADDIYFVIYCISSTDEEATQYAIDEQVSILKSEKLKEFYDEYTKSMNITVNDALWNSITFSQAIFSEEDIEDILSEEITTGTENTTE